MDRPPPSPRPPKRRRILRWTGGLLLLLLAFLPLLAWRWKPARALKIVIVDKTVPDTSRREHAGLVWVLQHRKFRRADGEDYRTDRDYYGFFPLPGQRWETREPSIPEAAPELLYLADTYGVYTEEFYGRNLGNRTSALYGGLRREEAEAIEKALPGCLTLVGEFNTFASPTEGAARRACEAWFGLTWNGWIARFFPDLDRTREVPPWAVRNYERETGRDWDFEGPGFLFVNEDDRVEVFQEGKDVKGDTGLRLRTLPGGRAYGLPRDARYDYWFDLVRPRPGTEVLAEYELPLLPAGEARLKALGLWNPGGRYPAILAAWRGTTRTYYLAGDFVDTWPMPDFHRLAGYAPFRRATAWERAGNGTSFFWKVYVPFTSAVLEDTWRRRQDRKG